VSTAHASAHAPDGAAGSGPAASDPDTWLSVALYSDDVDTRAKVRRAVGRRPAADLPPVRWTEFATFPALLRAVEHGGFDVLVLDGEASPVGGMGACRQLKDEIYECPPVLVLTGRPQDAWLAAWSRAEAAVPHPLDPRALARSLAALARRAVAG
jgi:DNA-binding response OmpR family regulator